MILGPLLSSPLVIGVHTGAAQLALAVGTFVLLRPKGDLPHRWLGRACVALMLVAVLLGLFVHEIRSWGPFGVIHLLVILTLSGLAQGIWHIRRGNVAAHGRAMRSTFLLSLVVAGAFTLLPGRRMSQVLLGSEAPPALAFAALALVLVAAGTLALRWRREEARIARRDGAPAAA